MQTPDPGFKVPDSKSPKAPDGSNPALSTTPPPAAGTPIEVAPVAGAPATDTSTRDIAIGSGIFVVLLLVFFLARNAYANHLVRKRVSPASADTAGWLMFFGLSFLSAAVVLGLLNASKFLNLAVTGTLLVFGIAALVGAFITGRR
ncbi:hypothetical protein [Massilia endophytica]|uniref:hypothetical protein n=1 Tax=Massilia endophytica TaxID=2899220 RepID=UPI001E5A6DF9|nr:hypothetical protein [Massilia endophytica]UGQ45396.1 hypothetical protein LSQ66_16585 [Massilia endophytica]